MISPYSQKLYERIQKKNKKGIVTADSLYEDKTYKATIKIAEAIKELQAESLITIKSITNRGRFETELIPSEGYIQHSNIKGVLRKEDDNEGEEEKTPKRRYQRRKVRRSVI